MARIVVADNDLDALDLALTDLRLEGHDVYGALDAADAEALVGTLSPDVVVLDYRMPPGITGLELAERLVADDPDLRIVIYSNYQKVELRARAAKIGVPFLAKGNLRALRSAVLQAMNEQPRVQRRWEEAAAILLITVLAAVAVILVARDVSGVKAERADPGSDRRRCRTGRRCVAHRDERRRRRHRSEVEGGALRPGRVRRNHQRDRHPRP